MNKKKIIVIAGPTAVGKTSLAIRIATRIGTEIISADSRQCFREMDIGVAKPTADDLALVAHHFINSHSIHEMVTASTFADYASKAANQIFLNNDVLVMVGGTGLYIKAFLEGLDEIPIIDESVRKNIISQFDREGLSWLQNSVQLEDPVYFADGEIQNPMRLMRALEVKRGTGKSIREFHNSRKASREFDWIMYCLQLPRDHLIENIQFRTEAMIRNGLVEEAKSLLPYRNLNALNTVGYKELFSYFDNAITLDNAITQIQSNTLKYAKRQVTWFKKQRTQWILPTDDETILQNFEK